jgi:hypothetical protein
MDSLTQPVIHLTRLTAGLALSCPAAINTPADLQAADSIPRVRASLKAQRDDIFSVAEKLAIAA